MSGNKLLEALSQDNDSQNIIGTLRRMSDQEQSYNQRSKDSYSREPYSKESYPKESYSKESYPKDYNSRESYSREPRSKEPYSKDYNSRESYSKEPRSREPYSKEHYSKESYSKDSKDQKFKEPYQNKRYNQDSKPYQKGSWKSPYSDVPSDSFYVYGPVQRNAEALSAMISGRQKVVDMEPNITTEQDYMKMAGEICDILNSKTALIFGTQASKIKNKKQHIESGGCKYGLSCQLGINNPEQDHGRSHTESENILFHILRMVYHHKPNVDISSKPYRQPNKYSVSDDEEEEVTKEFIHEFPHNMYAVPKIKYNFKEVDRQLNEVFLDFLAGRGSLDRFGTSKSSGYKSDKWCPHAICYDHLDKKECTKMHDDDVVFLSRLLRIFVTIKRDNAEPTPTKVVAPTPNKSQNKYSILAESEDLQKSDFQEPQENEETPFQKSDFQEPQELQNSQEHQKKEDTVVLDVQE